MKTAIRCPYHQERTPSCVIVDNKHFHCFGCGLSGPVEALKDQMLWAGRDVEWLTLSTGQPDQ